MMQNPKRFPKGNGINTRAILIQTLDKVCAGSAVEFGNECGGGAKATFNRIYINLDF